MLAAACLFAMPVIIHAESKAAPEAAAISLFDGETLAGWSHVLVDKNLAMEDVWSVKDGVLVCQGKPLGYLVTKESFQDFKLSLEWRWAAEPGNSGVLLRIAGEPVGFMPKCVEAQLKHESAGDIWAFRGAKVDGPKERLKVVEDHEELGDFRGVGKMKMAEKPVGEWNHYEIVVRGESIEVMINGQLVNRAHGLEKTVGPIGLQSEGSEIHFRNIRLQKPAPPASGREAGPQPDLTEEQKALRELMTRVQKHLKAEEWGETLKVVEELEEALPAEHKLMAEHIRLTVALGQKDAVESAARATAISQDQRVAGNATSLALLAQRLLAAEGLEPPPIDVALKIAEAAQAKSNDRDMLTLSTLAAAYHAAGQREKAVTTQEKAILAAPIQLKARFERALEEYRKGLAKDEEE